MRTTLDIDAPVLEALKEIARRQNRTAGAVATDLLRQALSRPTQVVRDEAGTYGFVPFPASGDPTPVTNEDVNRLREQLGI